MKGEMKTLYAVKLHQQPDVAPNTVSESVCLIQSVSLSQSVHTSGCLDVRHTENLPIWIESQQHLQAAARSFQKSVVGVIQKLLFEPIQIVMQVLFLHQFSLGMHRQFGDNAGRLR